MAVDILVCIKILFNEVVLIHFSGPQFILCSYIIYHGNRIRHDFERKNGTTISSAVGDGAIMPGYCPKSTIKNDPSVIKGSSILLKTTIPFSG
jgi:hypothetical protein